MGDWAHVDVCASIGCRWYLMGLFAASEEESKLNLGFDE